MAPVIPRDVGGPGPEGSAVSAPAPADPSSPGPDGAPRGEKVIAMGDRQTPVPARNDRTATAGQNCGVTFTITTPWGSTFVS